MRAINDPLIIFGGTFDPIHLGHIDIINQINKTTDAIITLLPANAPNYKPRLQTTNQQRLEMLELVFEANKNIIIDPRELMFPEYSHTFKTISKLRKEYGNTISINFIVGSDSILSLNKWDNWQELICITNFIVFRRSNYDLTRLRNEIDIIIQPRLVNDMKQLFDKAGGSIYIADFIPPEISSTIIRNKINLGQDIANLVPSIVFKYITDHHLYLPSTLSY